jgi:hypothetical protein
MRFIAAAALAFASFALPAGAAPKGPFGVKSGIVESETDMMGKQTQVLYFDDYGTKTATRTTTEVTMFGITNRSVAVSISAGGEQIEYDPEKKTGHSRKAGGSAASAVPDPAALDAKMRAEYKYEEQPDRTYLGKVCKGFAIEVMKGTPMRAWTWKGIPLYTETRVGNGLVTMKATSLQVDVAVPADKFTVPSDVKITPR